MNIIQRANGPNCLHCNAGFETLRHKFSECPRVAVAWTYVQQRFTTKFDRWQRPSFDDLIRPILHGVAAARKSQILKTFINYINFVNATVNNRIDVDALEFHLNLED